MRICIIEHSSIPEETLTYFKDMGIEVGKVFDVPSLDFLDLLIKNCGSVLSFGGYDPDIDKNVICIAHPYDF